MCTLVAAVLCGVLLNSMVVAPPTAVQSNWITFTTAKGCGHRVTLASPVTAGNAVLLGVLGGPTGNGSVSLTVQDTAGNNYTLLGQPVAFAPQGFFMSLFGALAVQPSSSFSFCLQPMGSNVDFYVAEYAGVAGVESAVNFSNDTQVGGHFVGGPVAASCADDTLFGFASGEVSVEPDASLNPVLVTGGNFLADTAVMSVGSFSMGGNLTGTAWFMTNVMLKGTNCPQLITSSIPVGQLVTVNGNATVSSPVIAGSLVVSGFLTFVGPATLLTSTGSVMVGSSAMVSSSVALSVSQGAQLSVNGTLTVQPGASVTPVITSLTPSVVTLTIASYVNISGSFRLNNAIFGGSLSPQCATLSSSNPNYGTTALTVTVTISQATSCGTGAGTTVPTTSSPLSTAAIIGIAVGGAVFIGASAVIIVVLLVRRHREKQAWAKVSHKIATEL